jgi:hypothetical protein
MVAALAWGALSGAAADNSFYGPSGLFVVPSTDTAAPATVNGSVYWAEDLSTVITANVGVLDCLEMTPAWLDPEQGDSTLVFSAKWRIWDEEEDRPALAVGMFDIADEYDSTPYAVLQKHFQLGLNRVRVVAGIGGDGDVLDGLFAGAQVYFTEDISALVEYDGDEVSAGLRWPVGDNLQLTAGAVRNKLAAGLQMSFP